jgi:hypothetical protein
MGIPGLTRALRPYLTTTTLSGESVVIDGPALAYTMLHYCNFQQPLQDAILGRLSYASIGQYTIQWLDKLRDNNIHV